MAEGSTPRRKRAPPPPAAPFLYRRRIRGADSDPAAIAHTARLPEICMEALEAWYRDQLGFAW